MDFSLKWRRLNPTVFFPFLSKKYLTVEASNFRLGQLKIAHLLSVKVNTNIIYRNNQLELQEQTHTLVMGTETE
jgi:hypothetical protein